MSVLILPRRFYFFTKTMLGWIFFQSTLGRSFQNEVLGRRLTSIGYRAPFESKKNGADAIKTESITDGIFLRVAPKNFGVL